MGDHQSLFPHEQAGVEGKVEMPVTEDQDEEMAIIAGEIQRLTRRCNELSLMVTFSLLLSFALGVLVAWKFGWFPF
jgi:hypothetical protein